MQRNTSLSRKVVVWTVHMLDALTSAFHPIQVIQYFFKDASPPPGVPGDSLHRGSLVTLAKPAPYEPRRPPKTLVRSFSPTLGGL
ncbi:hypothetical protein DFH06DRAFT_1182154 [Mycena polygramma]|nr:hypothetical protein DFH06DRAFT_1182154 [Mycena polygramma]